MMDVAPTSTYTPLANSIQMQKQVAERSDKSDATAVDILKLAIEANKASAQPLTATALADYAEVLWQWTTTDVWPPKVKT